MNLHLVIAFIVFVTSCRMCSRHIYIYDVNKLDSPLHGHQLDTNPAVLIPYYDEDSQTLFVTGRVNIPYYCICRYDNVTLIPLVLQLGLQIGPIQRMGAN
jgi:hypothetical protein